MKEILKRINLYLLFAVLLVIILYYGRSILIPAVFGALLAMLMTPLANRLEKWNWKRGLSSALCIIILLLAISGMFTVISLQVPSFKKDADTIKEKAQTFKHEAQKYIEEKLNIPEKKQEEIVEEQKQNTKQTGGNVCR